MNSERKKHISDEFLNEMKQIVHMIIDKGEEMDTPIETICMAAKMLDAELNGATNES